jgi:membrane associated rhomboid family serine protease
MIPLRDDQPVFSVPFINYFLIGLNVLVFLWEQAVGFQSPGTLQAVIGQFGLVPQHTVAVLTGHSYDPLASGIVPIFTSMFLHGGFWHVAFNMLFLWIFGDNVEDYLGHFRYLFFYLTSGVAGSIVHILLNINSPMPTVGASGAIAGVMGGYFILYPRARVLVWFPPIFFFHLPAWLMLGYWFLVQFFSGTMATVGNNGVAVWAHIGGFVAGVVMIKAFRERPHRYRYGTW